MPLGIETKVDSPDKLAAVSGKPTENYLFAEEFNQIVQKSDELEASKADLVGGKVPAEQLPSYVDDVLEFTDLASFPVTGETGKIYLALDTNKTYRWSGSAYVQIGVGKRTWMVAWTGVLYFDGNSGNGNWSGLNATSASTFGLLGGTNGTIFQTPVGTGGLPSPQSPARVIPYNCKIKYFHIRNGVSPFSAVSPANFRLRFHTHTPNGTTTLNNPVLQGEFDSTGFNMPTNYVYPSSCFTNNNLTLQAGDVITPIMRGLQALTAGALISDFYLEFEEI
ncbi:hypothetical protein [Flavobacterium sp. N2820]|uniref:hypothetical protein n=1 Tax=Flavobacterium sp. N2820 TaxID=2986834 RepID=UPI0022246512|nr:hypothetical protein [Flavobacterium sp. N2820]